MQGLKIKQLFLQFNIDYYNLIIMKGITRNIEKELLLTAHLYGDKLLDIQPLEIKV
jgi:hypothetical protein